MLKPEAAKARLDGWCLPESEDRVTAGVNSLEPRVREIGKILCKCDDEAAKELDQRAATRRRQQAVIDFDRLSRNDRAALFGVLSPHLAGAMEAAWQLLKTAPYQRGYSSKAFRAPTHPQITAECRFDWLETMASFAKSYPPDLLTLPWLAAWAPHLGRRDIIYYHPGALTHVIGVILASVLSRPGNDADEVFEILRQSLTNQHEIGAMGRHITEAFLLADRAEGWELIEKTLLAAQRQEGLRQAILESIDMAHPQAFRRMLRLILEHDLLRFSATVRAIDVWFGQLWAAASAGIVKKMLAQVVEFLDDPGERGAALDGKDPQAAFLALWCLATEDAVASIELAQKLLRAKSVEMRYIAARHLANLDLDVASAALSDALDDEDLRVALVGLRFGQYETDCDESLDSPVNGHFEKIECLLERVPAKPQRLKPLVWPWTEIEVKQSQVAAALLRARGSRPATQLIPHLNKMDSYARSAAAATILGDKPWDVATRQAAFDLVGSASTGVREQALDALLEQTLEGGEIERLESYLSRTSGDLRRGVLKVLQKQNDGEALASAARLVAAKHAGQRLAGLELLHLMADAQRSVPDCRRQAAAYRATRGKMSKEELAHLDEIAKDKASVAALDDALGLMNPADRTPVIPPRNLKTTFITAAAVECLKSLDDLIHEHREVSIRYQSYSGVEEELLGNVRWGFPRPDFDKPRDVQIARLPLADVWTRWFRDRPKRLRDDDGCEIVRALAWRGVHSGYDSDHWKKWSQANSARKEAAKILSGGHSRVKCRYGGLVESILDWLLFLHPIDACDFLLDASETAYSLVPATDMESLASPDAHQFRHFARLIDVDDDNADWREEKAFELWPERLSTTARLTGRKLTTDQRVRQWRLFHWRDEPFAGAPRQRPDSDLLLDAFEAGAAALADIADALLGPRGAGPYSAEGFDLLAAWTERKLSKEHEAFLSRQPAVRELRDRAVGRILELELARGDAATAATAPAWFLRALFGAQTLHRILRALGKAEFKLGQRWARGGNVGRRETLTQLASVTYPSAEDTPDEFVRQMREAVKSGDFPEERLLQLAFLAPQWTKFVEAYFQWKGFDEGVYWFLAHMSFVFDATQNAALAGGQTEEADDSAEAESEANDDSDDDDTDSPKPPAPRKLTPWERLIAERSPLEKEERDAGAIDVQWFQRTYESFGPKRWQAMAQAARFAANANQAKRAQFIGEVLLNKAKRKDLIAGIKKKQLKEYVRLLGLLPLAAGKQREADLRERCQVLRDYRRYANTLSGLTKPDALRAWEIGMKNLAQTAGFADPLRLEWAVGAEAVKDLAKGPVTVVRDGVTVSLTLDDNAQPVVTTRKGPKELKAIPPAIKKDKKIAELVARAADLRRQASSIRRSLETAMCRGDTFSGDELRAWCGHALLWPHLSRLVVVGEGILGYPDKGGKTLRDFRGKLEPVKAKETLRLAHPHDLLASGDWHSWQHECFQAERMQPFKQVFRELYVITKQEKKDGAVSHRYDGQQVQPKQAMALFGSRGWNTGDGVFKVFHDERIVVEIHFDFGITTPAEVEGWTMAGVSFRRSDEWKPLKLSAVPARLFSEAMRDLDLVVSVAHAGGVDPEASASTVEMRSGLVRETCDLLKLKNVRLKSNHALIHGELADYSVHLGSGVVHRVPGGAVCIVPVHAQHRGRLFLPFADDDPRTAEVISKILLLARDREIQDPVILEQLRR